MSDQDPETKAKEAEALEEFTKAIDAAIQVMEKSVGKELVYITLSLLTPEQRVVANNAKYALAVLAREFDSDKAPESADHYIAADGSRLTVN